MTVPLQLASIHCSYGKYLNSMTLDPVRAGEVGQATKFTILDLKLNHNILRLTLTTVSSPGVSYGWLEQVSSTGSQLTLKPLKSIHLEKSRQITRRQLELQSTIGSLSKY